MSARLRVPCRQCGTPVDLAGPFHHCTPEPARIDTYDVAQALGLPHAELDQMVARVEARTSR